MALFQQSVNANLNRNVFRWCLNCSVFEIQQIPVSRRFHWRGVAMKNARSPCLSLVRGINKSPLFCRSRRWTTRLGRYQERREISRQLSCHCQVGEHYSSNIVEANSRPITITLINKQKNKHYAFKIRYFLQEWSAWDKNFHLGLESNYM